MFLAHILSTVLQTIRIQHIFYLNVYHGKAQHTRSLDAPVFRQPLQNRPGLVSSVVPTLP
jgi:hypothetical protein